MAFSRRADAREADAQAARDVDAAWRRAAM